MQKQTTEPFARLDNNPELRNKILPYCRLQKGEVWEDQIHGHRIGVLDATNSNDIEKICGSEKASLAIQDPPYNIIVGNFNTNHLSKLSLGEYMSFSKQWVENTMKVLDKNSSLYVWLGADQKEHFQPLPDFMVMMRQYSELISRSYITMRNQRGYGTHKNWMAV